MIFRKRFLSRSASRFLWGLLLAGLSWVMMDLYSDVLLGVQSNRWPSVPGTVLAAGGKKTNVAQSGEVPEMSYWVDVRYRYTVSGQSYTNGNIQFGMQKGSREEALRRLKHLPRGRTLSVYYRPSDPQKSVLIRGLIPGHKMVFIGLGLVWLLCAGGLVFGWRWQRT